MKTFRHVLVSLAVVVGFALAAACFVVQEQPQNPPPSSTVEPDTRPQPIASPGPAAPPEPVVQPEPAPPAPARPDVDCNAPPARVCCKALTPQCRECARQAREERQLWEQACNPSPPPAQPAPEPVVDCSQRPVRACCRANTPACRECARKSSQELARWQAACEAPPAVDCSQPPGRMCCQAMMPACNECRRKAAEEHAAWEKQCGSSSGGH